MAGIIYENNLIVPIDKIDLYWSNKGQRGCAEKRLSIRFRIKPNLNVIQTYKYLGNSMVEKIILDVPRNERVQIICEK